VVWLLMRACGGSHPGLGGPGLGSGTGGGPITTIPGGPVIHTSGANPSDVPGEDLAGRARTAALAAHAYHLAGTVDLTATGPITVDLTLAEHTTTGHLTVGGATVEVRRTGLKIENRPAGAATWTESDTARLPNGDSISLPPLLDAEHWLIELIPTPEAATASAKPERLTPTGPLVTRIRLRGGHYLYVAATGTPYPAKLSNPDGPNPNLTFDRWS
jgi:hypothetical protein